MRKITQQVLFFVFACFLFYACQTPSELVHEHPHVPVNSLFSELTSDTDFISVNNQVTLKMQALANRINRSTDAENQFLRDLRSKYLSFSEFSKKATTEEKARYAQLVNVSFDNRVLLNSLASLQSKYSNKLSDLKQAFIEKTKQNSETKELVRPECEYNCRDQASDIYHSTYFDATQLGLPRQEADQAAEAAAYWYLQGCMEGCSSCPCYTPGV